MHELEYLSYLACWYLCSYIDSHRFRDIHQYPKAITALNTLISPDFPVKILWKRTASINFYSGD